VIEYGLPFIYKGGGGGVPKHTEYRCSLLLQMEWSDPSVCVVGTSMSHAKMAEAIEMPFGADSHGPRSHVSAGGTCTGATWQMQQIDQCGGGDAAYRYHYCSNLFTLHKLKN